MDKSRADFARHERRYITARRAHIVEHMEALEEEHKILGDRLAALDSMESLYDQTERQLEQVRNAQRRVSQEISNLVDDTPNEELPRRTQAIQSLRKLDIAEVG